MLRSRFIRSATSLTRVSTSLKRRLHNKTKKCNNRYEIFLNLNLKKFDYHYETIFHLIYTFAAMYKRCLHD